MQIEWLNTDTTNVDIYLILDFASLDKSLKSLPMIAYSYFRSRQSFLIFDGRLDIQHNDIQHSDIQHNDIQHNDIQHNDIQHNDNQHSDIQHNDSQPYGLVCNTQH
jgi:hypothetical protein